MNWSFEAAASAPSLELSTIHLLITSGLQGTKVLFMAICVGGGGVICETRPKLSLIGLIPL